MFRIKTDIRQYKCESREKVERLIRNWVVRPTDLIFYDDKQEWGPIGEHSEFVSTFAELAKREEQAPDTIVSSETPPSVETDLGAEEDEPEPPDPPEGVEPDDAEPDEITVMTEETLEDYLEDEEERDGSISVVETRDSDEETPAGSADEAAGPSEAESDGEEADTDVSGDAPTNPDVEPPTDVVDPSAPTDPEDMRPAHQPGGAERAEAAGAAGTAETGSETEEPTDPEIPSSEAPGGAAGVTWPDPDAVGRKDIGPDEETLPPEEGTGGDELRDTDEIEDDEESEPEPEGRRGALEDGAAESEYEVSGEMRTHRDDDQLGRHDLPEEVFVTNELEEGEDIDTVGDRAMGTEGAVDYKQVEEALQKNAEAARQKHVDDEWDEILDRLRQTDELSNEEIEEITETRDRFAIGRDEGEEPDDADEVPEEIEEYVSEGYEKELPVAVGPTRRDVQLGLPQGRASEADRDRVFPYPGPKREGRAQTRRFVLRAPTDHSLTVILGVFGLVVFLIIAAVAMF